MILQWWKFVFACCHFYDLRNGIRKSIGWCYFWCHSDKPKVVRSYLEGTNHTSKEIDQIVSIKGTRKSLYYIDDALLESIAPDIILRKMFVMYVK
jgi:hypothetical protein